MIKQQPIKSCPKCHAPIPDNAEYCICGYKNHKGSAMDDLLDIWGIKNEIKENPCNGNQ